MAVNDADNPDVLSYSNPLLDKLISVPGLSVAVTTLKKLLTWGTSNSLWMFPMATSCCGIEFMASMAARVNLDRMGTIVRATPRQCDVMVVAGTITVKMAPRVKKLWDLMPEPKWCIAMGSCAISGDFYRDIYSVIPGVDTVVPVDIYIPGCPPNPEQLMAGLQRLQEKIVLQRDGKWVVPETRPETAPMNVPEIGRVHLPERDPAVSIAQARNSNLLGLNGNEHRNSDFFDGTGHGEVPHHVAFAANPSKAKEGKDRMTPELAASVAELINDATPATEGEGEAVTLGADDIAEVENWVPAKAHYELARMLKMAGYTMYVTVVASHWPQEKKSRRNPDPPPEHFQVATVLRNPDKGASTTFGWRVKLEPGAPIDSLVPLFAGADWQEREQYDLVGIVFTGHPDLRRLMMPEDWPGHPLRRDYAIDTAHFPWR